MKGRTIKKASIAVLLAVGVSLAIAVGALALLSRQVTHCGDMRRTKALADVVAIAEALELFRRDHDRLPTIDEGLHHLAEMSSPSTGEAYLWAFPMDPWGRPYRYSTNGHTYSVVSLGADGSEGGESDDADVESDAILAQWRNKPLQPTRAASLLRQRETQRFGPRG
jgi:general secretion pathway protein G